MLNFNTSYKIGLLFSVYRNRVRKVAVKTGTTYATLQRVSLLRGVQRRCVWAVRRIIAACLACVRCDVLSCLLCRTAGVNLVRPTIAFCVGVRSAVAPPLDTTRRFCLCTVSCLVYVCRFELHRRLLWTCLDFKFSVGHSFVGKPIHTSEADTTETRPFRLVFGGVRNCGGSGMWATKWHESTISTKVGKCRQGRI